jgi:hypothetical protein
VTKHETGLLRHLIRVPVDPPAGLIEAARFDVIQTTEQVLKTFRELPKYAPGLPPIPEKIVESIITDRPLELIWS